MVALQPVTFLEIHPFAIFQEFFRAKMLFYKLLQKFNTLSETSELDKNRSCRVVFRIKKPFPRGFLIQRCSEHIKQMYRRTNIKQATLLNHISTWVFSFNFATYPQNTLQHLWMTASGGNIYTDTRNVTQISVLSSNSTSKSTFWIFMRTILFFLGVRSCKESTQILQKTYMNQFHC